ncbi:MAG: D-tyrosyl-tRNA(Tyr) deacylase [Vicingaceae bacterium]|jgi:D-tyrosyl-tRNA(Tyr) deacylase
MRVIIQRVSQAKVTVDREIVGEISQGLLLLLGIEEADTKEDIDWLCRKVCNMRIFGDENGNMNLSLKDVHGGVLVVSQLTLHASTKKGNRPSFIKAAKPDFAEKMYEDFKDTIASEFGKPIACGRFGADMKVSLVNDGPVTISLDSKNKE